MNGILSLFIGFLLFSFVSNAGYEKTTWGMKLSKVKKLYPNGVKKVQPNGQVTYTLIRSIALAADTYTMFRFSKDEKLSAVVIMFPESATNEDLRKGNFMELSKDDAKSLFSKLEEQLTIKYGEKVGNVDKDMIMWKVSDKDFIALTIEKSKIDNERSTLAVIYSEIPESVDLGEGL